MRCFQMIDQFMEDARGDASIGTTKKGIGPAYATKAFRTGLRVSVESIGQ